MAGRIITHEDLDARLDEAAVDPDRFSERALEIARELDAGGVDLEVRDSSAWRRPLPEVAEDDEPTRVALASQLRYEIESFELLDREAEARLARRIEFAKIRLEDAIEHAGLTLDDVLGTVSRTSWSYHETGAFECELPQPVCRRWMEWHQLRTEMEERNLYLVLINVERYAHTTASRLDLIQEGAASLFRAVDGFNWRRGLLFRTYAVHWLNQAFRSYLYNFSNTVRVPVYLQKAMKHINQAIERLGDPDASVEQIAKEADLGENLVATALTAARGTHSIDAPIGDEDERSGLAELLRVDNDGGPYSTDLEDISLSEGLNQAMDRLSDRERYVVSMRFGVGQAREHTLAEVAGELGVSLERVRQIQVRAISKMRTPSLRKAVDPFLNN